MTSFAPRVRCYTRLYVRFLPRNREATRNCILAGGSADGRRARAVLGAKIYSATIRFAASASGWFFSFLFLSLSLIDRDLGHFCNTTSMANVRHAVNTVKLNFISGSFSVKRGMRCSIVRFFENERGTCRRDLVLDAHECVSVQFQ